MNQNTFPNIDFDIMRKSMLESFNMLSTIPQTSILIPKIPIITPQTSIYSTPPNPPIPIIDNQFYNSPEFIKLENEVYQEVIPIWKKSAEIMFNNGWWLILSLTYDYYFSELPEKAAEITPDSLNAYITNYMNKNSFANLEEIIDNWQVECYKQKEYIFRDALWAHKNNKYTLSVPALTIQLEGILRDFFPDLKGGNVHKYKARLKKQFKTLTKDNTESIFKNFINECNLKFLEIRLEELYSQFDSSKADENPLFNRHALAHGLWDGYYNLETSTKLFLLLDMLHSILKSVQKFDP